MTAQSPGPDAVARDEVGEAAVVRTVEDARAWERDGVVVTGNTGVAYQCHDRKWTPARPASWAVGSDWLFDYDHFPLTVIHDPDAPHLTPQPDGDEVEGLVTYLLSHWRTTEDTAREVARRVLASGLVVPVGEVSDR